MYLSFSGRNISDMFAIKHTEPIIKIHFIVFRENRTNTMNSTMYTAVLIPNTKYGFGSPFRNMYVVKSRKVRVRGCETMKTKMWNVKKFQINLKNFLMLEFLYRHTPQMQPSTKHPQQLKGYGSSSTFFLLMAYSIKLSHISTNVSLRLKPVSILTSM